jgi:hypothetical protein
VIKNILPIAIQWQVSIFSPPGYFIYHSSIYFVVTVVHIHAMKGIPFLDNGILTRNDIQYVHILKFTIWVSVMVLNVTFNNIQLNHSFWAYFLSFLFVIRNASCYYFFISIISFSSLWYQEYFNKLKHSIWFSENNNLTRTPVKEGKLIF